MRTSRPAPEAGPTPLGGPPTIDQPLHPFAARAGERLLARLADGATGYHHASLDAGAVRSAFEAGLRATLARLAAPTLTHTLRLARERGELDGTDSRARFEDFVRRTGEPAGTAALFARYPGLATLVAQTCRQAVDATAETLTRFLRDRDAIVGELLDGTDPGPLVAVDTTGGDRHQDGRCVTLLRFAGRPDPVVHRPRPAASLVHWASVVRWLNGRLPGLGLTTVAVIDRGDYGWARFVAPAPCRSRREARRFYHRQGALLAVLHAAGGSDVHADNLVAHRDRPVLIDMETLLHPVLPRTALTGADPALAFLEESAQRTLLLPTLLHGRDAATDISGIGGLGTAPGEDAPHWIDAGLDTMRLGHAPAAAPPGTGAVPPNRPSLDGVLLAPADHLPDLLRGFGDAHAAIRRDADGFLAVLATAADVPMRLVARPTRTYAELLEDAILPGALRDDGRRRALLRSLADEPAFDGASWLPEHEYPDLERGDVPLFFFRPGGRSVRTGRGVTVPGVFATTPLDAVTAKVRAMDEEDHRRQRWIIEAAFATGAGPVRHHAGAAMAPAAPVAAAVPVPVPAAVPAVRPAAFDPQWALDRALDAARELDGLAHRRDGRVNWLGLEPLEDGHWTVLPAGAGLAHGHTGIALFLGQLGALTGRPEFLERAALAIATVPALLGALAVRPGHLAAVGCGFTGLGGIVYALARLATLLDSADLRGWTADAIALLPAADTAAPHRDRDAFADGRAGALAALRAARRQLGQRATESGAEDALRTALAASRAGSTRGPGFLTGDDGITWALGDTAPGTDPAGPAADDGWCRGTAGTAAAGRLAPHTLRDWLDRLDRTPVAADLSPCHGELGVLDALAVLAPRDERARAVLGRRAAALPSALRGGAHRCGTPGAVPTPGLLHGLAGTGYGLLRTGFPDAVPSVLMLEPDPPRHG